MMSLRLATAFAVLSVCSLSVPARAQDFPVFQGGSAKRDVPDFSPLETRLIGQKHWLKGAPAAVRLIVTDHRTGKPISAQIEVSVSAHVDGINKGRATRLFTGRTGPFGTLDMPLGTGGLAAGPYDLEVDVHTAIGEDHLSTPIRVSEDAQIMLVSDKPVYQPGQRLHLRALAMDRGTRHALSQLPITFEVEDARGNKVFKKKTQLSGFGLASADFELADEVIMGLYTLRATMQEYRVEKKVRVERYQLPKFKVSLKTERPFYQPGEMMKGKLQADYFFGKPVANGRVAISVETLDTGVSKVGELSGKTDANGTYRFEFMVPRALVGQPIEHGNGILGLKARLLDTADHLQEAALSVPVSAEGLDLLIQAEGPTLVPHVQNLIYLAAATPDGTPIKNARISVSTNLEDKPEVVTTDALGIAVAHCMAGIDEETVVADIVTPDGKRARFTRKLASRKQKEGVLLRVDRQIARVGEEIRMTALTPAEKGTIYLDVIRNGQTILTRSQAISENRAPMAVPLTDDMVGTLSLHAYRVQGDDEIVRDTRTVVVLPADDLEIKVAANQASYRPGGEAELKISVRDKGRNPVQAALGLAVVDESVFALSELQPGLEKIYFALEHELLTPKAEVHGMSATRLILNPPEGEIREVSRQRAAAIVLAGYHPDGKYDYVLNTYRDRWDKVKAKAIAMIAQAHLKMLRAVEAFTRARQMQLTSDMGLYTLVSLGFLRDDDMRDPWGAYFRVNLHGAKNYNGWFTISSAGPDGDWDTVDDLTNISWFQNGQGEPNGGGGIARGGLGGMQGGGRIGGGMGGGGLGGGGFGGGGRGGGFGGGGMGGFGGGGFGGGRGGGGFGGAMGGGMMGGAPRGGAGGAGMGGRPGDALLPEGVNFVIGNELDNSAISTGRSGVEMKQRATMTAPEPRIRAFFPETMFWNPEVITDELGEAQVKLPLADSITTWRMSLSANTMNGRLGSSTAPLRVFQEFFADVDVPLVLTNGDRVEMPVTVYNYHPGALQVEVSLQTEPWFTLEGDARRTVKLEKDEVKVVYFPVTVKSAGSHTVTVKAMGSGLSDAVRRPVEVVPDGKEQTITLSDRLTKTRDLEVRFPPNALDGSRSLWIKFYPGVFSQIVEGMEGILRMPNGCFEQTSSATYPDVMALAYMKQTGKLKPEIEMQAERFINAGYQRLLTFEVQGGGFSLYGQPPAVPTLTAYGLLEFADMAKVRDVDPALIKRTQQWLIRQQKQNGSWEVGEDPVHGGIAIRSDSLRRTAFMTWALIESGYDGRELASAISFIKSRIHDAEDPYALALALIVLAAKEPDGEAGAICGKRLVGLAQPAQDGACWKNPSSTFTGAYANTADLETTGLAAYALVRWGRAAQTVEKALTYLIKQRGSYGAWATTQGTIWAMKALLTARTGGGGGDRQVTILVNGAKAGTVKMSADDSDVMRLVDLREFVRPDQNAVRLELSGEGGALYQIFGRYYIPWQDVRRELLNAGPLRIEVEYDKSRLAQNDLAVATVTIHNGSDRVAENPIIDLGIPPGFTLVQEKLEQAVAENRISKFTVSPRSITVYLDTLLPHQELKLEYTLRARFPVKAKTPASSAYPYYNPEKQSTVTPRIVEVTR